MIVRIKSQNKEFLSILNKNPNTDLGLYLRTLRNGHLIGNCVNENEYEVIFQDTKHSYTNYEDNQIDFKSYCSPEVILGVIRELFQHMVKPTEEVRKMSVPWLNTTVGALDTEPCEIIVDNFMIGDNWYRNDEFLLCRYMPEIQIEKTKGFNIFRLVISANSVVEAINILGVVSFLCAVSNDNNFFIEHGQVEKYATILTNTPNTPYFIYYLFIKRCCISPKLFEKVAPKFEAAFGGNVKFTPNDTHKDRMIFVKEHLDMDKPVLDIGCGEFSLEKFVLRHLKEKIVSYDVDDYTELYIKLKSRFTDKDWIFVNSFNHIPNIEYGSIALTEVIEHNTVEDATKLLMDISSNLLFDSLIITTPNKDFNVHYNLTDEEMRHYDHKFEFREEEFKNFIRTVFKNSVIEFFGVGDSVNGVCTTLACIVR